MLVQAFDDGTVMYCGYAQLVPAMVAKLFKGLLSSGRSPEYLSLDFGLILMDTQWFMCDKSLKSIAEAEP